LLISFVFRIIGKAYEQSNITLGKARRSGNHFDVRNADDAEGARPQKKVSV
jgi:hypothetical protein